jgi:trehalose 6-phosphate synthase
VGEALATALSMPLRERQARWEGMFKHLQKFDLVFWREYYMEALQEIARAA